MTSGDKLKIWRRLLIFAALLFLAGILLMIHPNNHPYQFDPTSNSSEAAQLDGYALGKTFSAWMFTAGDILIGLSIIISGICVYGINILQIKCKNQRVH